MSKIMHPQKRGESSDRKQDDLQCNRIEIQFGQGDRSDHQRGMVVEHIGQNGDESAHDQACLQQSLCYDWGARFYQYSSQSGVVQTINDNAHGESEDQNTATHSTGMAKEATKRRQRSVKTKPKIFSIKKVRFFLVLSVMKVGSEKGLFQIVFCGWQCLGQLVLHNKEHEGRHKQQSCGRRNKHHGRVHRQAHMDNFQGDQINDITNPDRSVGSRCNQCTA